MKTEKKENVINKKLVIKIIDEVNKVFEKYGLDIEAMKFIIDSMSFGTTNYLTHQMEDVNETFIKELFKSKGDFDYVG